MSRSFPVSCTALIMLPIDILMRTMSSWCNWLAVYSLFFSIIRVFSFLRQVYNSFFIFSIWILSSMGISLSPFFYNFPADSFNASISFLNMLLPLSLYFLDSDIFFSNSSFICSCFSIVSIFFFIRSVAVVSSLISFIVGIFFRVLFYCFI